MRRVPLLGAHVGTNVGDHLGEEQLVRRSGEVWEPSGGLEPGAERLRRVFDHAPFGMVVCDNVGTILEVNDAFARILGTDPATLLGTAHDDLVVEDDPAQILEWTDSGEPDVVVTDVRYRHADGSVVWARSTIRMERDADDAVVARLIHVADLTNLRRAEDALATSEARFRRAFDESPIGMALCSTESRLLWVNDSLCTLLGRAWVEVVGRRLRDFAHRDDVDLGARLIDAVLGGDSGRSEDEMRLVRPDGEVVWGRRDLHQPEQHRGRGAPHPGPRHRHHRRPRGRDPTRAPGHPRRPHRTARTASCSSTASARRSTGGSGAAERSW